MKKIRKEVPVLTAFRLYANQLKFITQEAKKRSESRAHVVRAAIDFYALHILK